MVRYEELIDVIRDYASTYKNKNEKEALTHFMRSIKASLDSEIINPSGYLLECAKLGYTGITVYSGIIPCLKENVLYYNLYKSLSNYFNIDDMNGFHISITPIPDSIVSAIKIHWNAPLSEEAKDSVYIKRKKIRDHTRDIVELKFKIR